MQAYLIEKARKAGYSALANADGSVTLILTFGVLGHGITRVEYRVRNYNEYTYIMGRDI